MEICYCWLLPKVIKSGFFTLIFITGGPPYLSVSSLKSFFDGCWVDFYNLLGWRATIGGLSGLPESFPC